jgi:hypothetical protein
MRNLLLLVLVGMLGWQGYRYYVADVHHRSAVPDLPPASADSSIAKANAFVPPSGPAFQCDGRTHCSQMTSCEEATYFLRNCPNVKMDGDNDGVPCEEQWCRR